MCVRGAPKRGKWRMYSAVKLSRERWSNIWKSTPYVRHGVAIRPRASETKWSCNAKQILRMSGRQLVKTMTKAGFLKDWSLHKCPHCRLGRVTGLGKRSGGNLAYRCRRSKCHKFIYPHSSHPLFSTADGRNYKELADQFVVLFGLVTGCTEAQNHLLWGDSRDFVKSMSRKLDCARKDYVIAKERAVRFGDPDKLQWRDVEADEVDLGKDLTAVPGKARWNQWAGIVERGRPESLMLFKTHPRITKIRAPGPGPIKKKEWRPVAEKHLKGRRILLHTDGARSYKIGRNRKDKIEGVIHDYVVHKLKVNRAGNWHLFSIRTQIRFNCRTVCWTL